VKYIHNLSNLVASISRGSLPWAGYFQGFNKVIVIVVALLHHLIDYCIRPQDVWKFCLFFINYEFLFNSIKLENAMKRLPVC